MMPGGAYTGILFTAGINGLAAQGSYNGFFAILSGSNSSTQAQLSNTAAYTVNVTPEPASLSLLGTGVLGLLFWTHQRRSRKV